MSGKWRENCSVCFIVERIKIVQIFIFVKYIRLSSERNFNTLKKFELSELNTSGLIDLTLKFSEVET